MSIVMEINPYEFFADTHGGALDAGYIWIGQPNLDPRQYPVTVYYDPALTIPAAMPLRTSNGYVVRNGSPTFLYIDGNYSVRVEDSRNRLVYYVPDFLLLGSSSAVSRSELENLGTLHIGHYQTVTEFLAAIIPSDANSVRVLGYYVAGDGGAHTKVRIATPSIVKPWHSQSGDGAWWEIRESSVSLVMFGGKRTYAFNSRQAFLDAIEYAKAFNVPIIDKGVYGIVGAITVDNRQVNILGIGPVAKMGYQTFDDKRWLRQGTDTDGVLFKDKVPGLAFIFKNGGPTNVQSLPNRTDDYASVSPCITFTFNGNVNETYAVIQDNDCFDAAGNYTPLGSQNTATDFNIGVFYKDTARNITRDLTVWGYFDRAGTCIWSADGNDDPDGNIFYGGMTAGRHGMSLIGASFPSVQVGGLSGTTFYGTTFGSKDNNSRVSGAGGLTVADYYVNADAEGWRCLFIDGDVAANTVDLAGHFMYGIVLRTSANYPVQLGACSSLKFFGGVQESGDYGVPGSDTTKWIAATYTGAGVVIDEMRVAELDAFFHPLWSGRIAFRISGGISGNASSIYSKVDPNVAGEFSAMKVGIGRGVGDVGIQFTKDLASENNGFAFGYDVSNDTAKLWREGVEVFTATADGVFTPRLLALQAGPTLTISSGSITVTTSNHTINAEGGVADDLVTIAGGTTNKQLLEIQIGVAQVTVKHGIGNIRCGTDKVLNNSLDRMVLEWISASNLWVQVAFSDNG